MGTVIMDIIILRIGNITWTDQCVQPKRGELIVVRDKFS